MAQTQAFNPIAFKQKMREEWSDAADGWRRWCHVVEGKDGGQRHSAKLVELARVRPGASVLDVGGGYGEPSLTAARVVGPKGASFVRISPLGSWLSPVSAPARLDSITSSLSKPTQSRSTSGRRASTR
jgi:hypothetical protein